MAKARLSRKQKKRAGSEPGGGAASMPEAGAWNPKLERAARKAEKESRAREKARAETEFREKLAKAKEEAERSRLALAEAEQARHEREATLAREWAAEDAPPPPAGMLQRLRSGLTKSRDALAAGLGRIVLGKKEIDGEVLRGLEEVLIGADLGAETTARLLRAVQGRMRRDEVREPERLTALLRAEVLRVMDKAYPPLDVEGRKPSVVLFVGVNGTGKTTTIGKLAQLHTAAGRKVLLAAGDTFRAAAGEQLARWAERTGCDLLQKAPGAEPSGVIYQGVRQGMEGGYDLVLCDTAGRLHTKSNLMEELKKVKRVMGNLIPAAPHETLLVLDANTGQNAIHQTREFHQALEITGLIVTKLDGTARGGVVVGIVNEFALPIRFIGVGEGVGDLRPFQADAFVAGLLE